MELEKTLSDLMELATEGLSEVDQRIENSDEEMTMQYKKYREQFVELGATIADLAVRMRLERNIDPKVESDIQKLSRKVGE